MSKVTAAACELLSSAKDAFHEEDISRLQLPPLETFDDKQISEPETELPTELTLPLDHDTSLDTTKPHGDQNEDTSLEDIEAKVFSLAGLLNMDCNIH